MNYAVMPLADYDAACDKVREKVDLTPPTIKSGELADKVEEVYWTAANNFGLKGKGQGELVTLNNVHPIEHKVEVGLSSKNLFNEAEANITKTEDYFKSNVGYSTDAFYSLAVEPNETYIATFMIRSEVEHVWGAELGVGIGSLPTYGQGRIALSLISKESYQNFATHTIRFTVPADVHIVYFQTNTEYKIKNFQIEKGNSATAYAPYVADFSDCKVRTTGKNLLNLEGRTVVNFGDHSNTTKRQFFGEKGIILGFARNNYYNGYNQEYKWSIDNNSFSYTIKAGWYGIGFDIKLLPNTTYRFSSQTLTGGISLTEYDAEGNYLGDNFFSSSAITTKPNTVWGIVSFYDDYGKISSAVNPQVEYGSVITEYEPPIAETEYTAAADGTVEGVKSISPTMNLTTNKAGAVIDAECFLDPQAVITDLTNTVITLGGEV